MNSRHRNSDLRTNDDRWGNCYQFKVVLLGMSGVGKTALLTRFIRNEFYSDEATIGASFHSHKMILDENHLKLEIWDTAGLERFRCLLPMYYRGSHAAIVVYNIQCRTSFQEAKELIQSLSREIPQKIVIALVGNKLDQLDLRSVSFREAAKYAKENDFLFMETSAKDATNVVDMFMTVSRELFNKKDQMRSRPIGTLRLTDTTTNWYEKCFSSILRKQS